MGARELYSSSILVAMHCPSRIMAQMIHERAARLISAFLPRLVKHEQTQKPRNERCFGSSRKFKSVAGMMIYLESGSCDSRVSRNDIDSLR